VLAAIAKMALAADGIGFAIDPSPVIEMQADESVWFAEIPAFVVEVLDPDGFAELEAHFGIAAYDAGETIAEPVAALGEECVAMADLREAWEAPLREFYGAA
jgi:hypothetical protein